MERTVFSTGEVKLLNPQMYCALLSFAYRNGLEITRRSSAPKCFRLPIGANGFWQQYSGIHGTGFKVVVYTKKKNADVLYLTFPEVHIKCYSG